MPNNFNKPFLKTNTRVSRCNYTYVSLNCYKNNSKIVYNTMYTTIGGAKKSDALKLFVKTFHSYIDLFETIPLHDLKTDKILIGKYLDELEKNDYLYNRAFQLAFEVSYNKRFFSRTDLERIYNEKISIRNPLDSEDRTSLLDQSTVYNIFQSMFLSKTFPNTEITINQTPSTLVDKNQLDAKTQANLNLNKTLTGNAFPDVYLNDKVYDFKTTNKPTNTQNHIYILIDSPQAYTEFIKHIKTLNEIKDQNNNWPTEYIKIYNTKLANLKNLLINNSSPESIKKVNEEWNTFLINDPQRPISFKMPLYIITTNSVPTDNIGDFKMNIDEGHLDFVKAKKAIIGVLLKKPDDLNEKIFEATNGALGHVIKKIDETKEP